MTETEKKALALVNAEQAKSGCLPIGAYHGPCMKALCRAIEQHEAFRQEVSDAVEVFRKQSGWVPAYFLRFIIAKTDPLVEAIADYKRTKGTGEYATNKDMANALRAAIEKRGGKIVWGEG